TAPRAHPSSGRARIPPRRRCPRADRRRAVRTGRPAPPHPAPDRRRRPQSRRRPARPTSAASPRWGEGIPRTGRTRPRPAARLSTASAWHQTCDESGTFCPQTVPGTAGVTEQELLVRRGGHYSRPMAEVAAEVRPRGPYSLALSARVAGDATRMFRDGVLTTMVPAGRGVAWQRPGGVLCLRAAGEGAFGQLRFCLAIDADHTPF